MKLFLIGLRGAGKTTVAAGLASRLQLPLLDTDARIQEVAGRTTAQIFAEEGEAGFRAREECVFRDLASAADAVVACGGGAVLSPTNREILRSAGRTVWLTASPECLLKRIEADPQSPHLRPQLTNTGGLDEIRQVLERRRALYAECADYTVDVESRSMAEIVDAIVAWWDSSDK